MKRERWNGKRETADVKRFPVFGNPHYIRPPPSPGFCRLTAGKTGAAGLGISLKLSELFTIHDSRFTFAVSRHFINQLIFSEIIFEKYLIFFLVVPNHL